MMRGDLLTRVISSESEKSFSFAVKKKQEGIGKRETPYSIHSGITAFHSRREKRTVNEKKHPRRCLGSQPPPLRGTSFHRKEGESCPRIASPYRHFERKREIFFVCGHERNRRASENGKHGTPYVLGSRRFIREENSERSTKSSLGGVYEERLFLIAMLFSISNFQDP